MSKHYEVMDPLYFSTGPYTKQHFIQWFEDYLIAKGIPDYVVIRGIPKTSLEGERALYNYQNSKLKKKYY